MDKNPFLSTKSPRGISTEQRSSQALYWQERCHATLDTLEREARRMLALEGELSEFASQYYATIGDAAERLAALEQSRDSWSSDPTFEAAVPDVMRQQEAMIHRRSELKSRYRNLAKTLHPDRAEPMEKTGLGAQAMHRLNAAYQHGDLAAMLRLEAERALVPLIGSPTQNHDGLEEALHAIEQASETYAEGYRAMLASPLNELMLRAMAARLAGWDWMEAVARKLEQTITQQQHAAARAGIAQITAWREHASHAA